MAKEEIKKEGLTINPSKVQRPKLTVIYATGKGEHMEKGSKREVSQEDAEHLVNTGHACYELNDAIKSGDSLDAKKAKAKTKGKNVSENPEGENPNE